MGIARSQGGQVARPFGVGVVRRQLDPAGDLAPGGADLLTETVLQPGVRSGQAEDQHRLVRQGAFDDLRTVRRRELRRVADLPLQRADLARQRRPVLAQRVDLTAQVARDRSVQRGGPDDDAKTQAPGRRR